MMKSCDTGGNRARHTLERNMPLVCVCVRLRIEVEAEWTLGVFIAEPIDNPSSHRAGYRGRSGHIMAHL